jgi:hypothetical protein
MVTGKKTRLWILAAFATALALSFGAGALYAANDAPKAHVAPLYPMLRCG